MQKVGRWAGREESPYSYYCGQLESNPAGVTLRISADHAFVSVLKGEGAGVFVHQLLSITGGGCSSRERAGGQREPWGRERQVLAAGRPECTERVRPARGGRCGGQCWWLLLLFCKKFDSATLL